MTSITSMGFSVFSSDLNEINLDEGSSRLLTTISPNSYGISTTDLFFREALKKSDILVLDGVYFALSSIILNAKNIKKNQGPDVFYNFMQRLNKKGAKVFFLGSTEEILRKIRTKALSQYPNIKVETYSPPYKKDFDDYDNNKMIKAINQFNPDLLFVGMTCPKQEKWAYQNRDKIKTKLICCIGAVFDWYAGNQKEIHPIWWKLRLGWLKRTIDRPEIITRYPNIGIFFGHLILALIGIKKYRYGLF